MELKNIRAIGLAAADARFQEISIPRRAATPHDSAHTKWSIHVSTKR